MCIKLAPTSREKPAAIEKNAVAEEMSRMVVGGLKAYYSMSRTRQAFTRVAGPKKKAPAKAPRVVLSFSLSENRRRVGIYAHALTVIYAVSEWRTLTRG